MNEFFRILIVDDDRRMTRTLADIFSLSGYEVTEAESGADSLEKVGKMTFDCVLSDIKMP
jgi:CheY-like chemotaxis protein